jgi:hypothetical protein
VVSALALLAGVALMGVAGPGLAGGYLAPTPARCGAASPIRLAADAGCVALDGTLGGIAIPQTGALADIGLNPAWFSATGALRAGLGRFSAAVEFDNTPQIRAVPPAPAERWPTSSYENAAARPEGRSWIVTPGEHEIAHAYVTAGTETTFVKLGKVERSVADTGDDEPFSPLDLFDSRAALAPGIQTSVAPALAGQSLQLVSDLGGGNLLGVGL